MLFVPLTLDEAVILRDELTSSISCLKSLCKGKMDEKMRKQVGKPLKKAEKLVKKAEKNNAKLANYDEKVRDPIIAKANKMKKGAR